MPPSQVNKKTFLLNRKIKHKNFNIFFWHRTTLPPSPFSFTFASQTCSGHGRAFSGRCRCDRNYYGDVCQHQVLKSASKNLGLIMFSYVFRTSARKTRTVEGTDDAGTSEPLHILGSSATARLATTGLAAANEATARQRSCRRDSTQRGTSARSLPSTGGS